LATHRIWQLTSPTPLSLQLAGETGITPLQARILINRGISDRSAIQSFLSPRLSDMLDPMLLKDMWEGTSFVLEAIEQGEGIGIFGDYDADGLTATALLFRFFRSLGIPVFFYIPNRLTQGYGLNESGIRWFHHSGIRRIVTVDCGSSDLRNIALARTLGMKVLVTDHHRMPKEFRPLCPVINPHRPDCLFPFKGLAGVGVAFLLAVSVRAALREKHFFRGKTEPDLREYLDLVALGTMADRVPLLDQNRTFVRSGLAAMQHTRWAGLEALKKDSSIGSTLSAFDLAYRFAPRLNAPGRMGVDNLSMRLLTEDEPPQAEHLVGLINGINGERQVVEKAILEQVHAGMESRDGILDRRTLVLSGQGWHQGVLGIVASRMVERYHRPALVLGLENGLAVGSGRSIAGFNLHQALSRLKHLFSRFGGHAHAAGFTLKAENLASLEAELEIVAGRVFEGGRACRASPDRCGAPPPRDRT
jgi:single-stranded-DNA-specific exonuclease